MYAPARWSRPTWLTGGADAILDAASMSDDPEETRDLVGRYQRNTRRAGAAVLPSSAGSPRSDAVFQRSVDEIKRLEAFRGVVVVPAWAWPAFGLLDVFMLLAIYPDASASWVLGIRLLLAPVPVAISLWARRPDVNVRRLDLAYSLMLVAMGVGISLMALEFGGLTSSYMHGVAVVIAAQASRVPEPWTRQLRIIIPTALSFPAVLGVAAIWSPELQTAWADPDTLASFASQYVFVLAVSIVGAVGGHAVWAAREQVYKARRLGAYRL